MQPIPRQPRHSFTPITLENLNDLTKLETVECFHKNPIAFFKERLNVDFDTVKSLNDIIVTTEYNPRGADDSISSFNFIFDSEKNYLAAFKALRYVFGQLYLSGHPKLNKSEETAVRCFIRAVEVGCELSARAAEALLLEGKGFSRRNCEYAKKVLGTNGGDNTQCLLGILHSQIKQPKLAEPHFETAFQKNPEAFFAHLIKYDHASAFALFNAMKDFSSSDALERKEELEKSAVPQFAFMWNSNATFGTAKQILNRLFGEMHLTGDNEVKRNDVEAALCFSVAGKLGCDNAQQKVAELYLQGRGFDTRTKRFAIGALEAASKSNPMAFFQLGILHSKLDLTEKASTYFTQAAESKNPTVLRQLGRLYLHGNTDANILPDINQAKHYVELAFANKLSSKQTLRLLEDIHAKLGSDISDPDMLCQLGKMHLDEMSALLSIKRRSNSPDFDASLKLARNKAMTYLHKAALARSPEACLLLGNAYFLGQFSVDDDHDIDQSTIQSTSIKPTNLLTAESYLQQAEKLGVTEASDPLKALRSLRTWSWSLQFPFNADTDKLPIKSDIDPTRLPMHETALKEAALAGYPDALFQAAMQDIHGPNEALLHAAAEKKHPEAAYQLGLIYQSKTDTWPLTKNQDKAMEYFKQAAMNSDNKHAAAMFELAEIHYARYSASPNSMVAPHQRNEADKYYRIIYKDCKGSDKHQSAEDRLNELNPNKPVKAPTPLSIQ